MIVGVGWEIASQALKMSFHRSMPLTCLLIHHKNPFFSDPHLAVVFISIPELPVTKMSSLTLVLHHSTYIELPTASRMFWNMQPCAVHWHFGQWQIASQVLFSSPWCLVMLVFDAVSSRTHLCLPRLLRASFFPCAWFNLMLFGSSCPLSIENRLLMLPVRDCVKWLTWKQN